MPNYTVTGLVLTSDSKPAPGLSIHLQSDSNHQYATTDSTGRYSFAAPSAYYTVLLGRSVVAQIQVKNADVTVPSFVNGKASDASGSPTPAPDTGSASEGPAVPRKAVRGTIIENSAAEGKAREAGFTLWRDWCSVNWSTGKINDGRDVANVNAKVARGWQVVLTVTVDEKANRTGSMCKDFSVVANQIIAGRLDKRVIVQLVNEANLDLYWPNGNVVEATQKFAVPIATKLKKAGYTVAAPSITYGYVPSIITWVNQIIANSPLGLWDYLDGHLYADLSQFKTTFAGWSALAKQYGTKLMASEWSHKVGNPAFAKELPAFVAIMDRHCSIHCNFSYTYGSKFSALNTYCWRDGKTTEVHDSWVAMKHQALPVRS